MSAIACTIHLVSELLCANSLTSTILQHIDEESHLQQAEDQWIPTFHLLAAKRQKAEIR